MIDISSITGISSYTKSSYTKSVDRLVDVYIKCNTVVNISTGLFCLGIYDLPNHDRELSVIEERYIDSTTGFIIPNWRNVRNYMKISDIGYGWTHSGFGDYCTDTYEDIQDDATERREMLESYYMMRKQNK